jgi:hypothetical protein
VPPPRSLQERTLAMGPFLATKHQLMNRRSTNKKDAYTLVS